jgi:flagellar secretion chaperone FliS
MTMPGERSAMKQNPAGTYLRTQIMTASPQQLRLMLYGGAIKFCRQALQFLDARDYEGSYNALMRAQKIVLELSTSLNREAAPDLCDKLGALYTYIYRLLIDANMHRAPAPIHEAIELLEYEQKTWQMLMRKLAEEADGGGQDGDDDGGGRAPSSPAADSGARQTAISSLSKSA